MSNVAFLNTIMDDPVNRHPQDFYPTPERGTLALLGVEKFRGKVWEPACGDGSMSKVLETRYKVISSELHDRGFGETGVDFLTQTKARAPNVVTNPPFTLAERFVVHALSLTTGKVAVFCRLAWLEGQKRRALFTTTPLARVWVFSRRLAMSRGGDPRWGEGSGKGGMIAFAWYVWEHGHEGPPALGWLP